MISPEMIYISLNYYKYKNLSELTKLVLSKTIVIGSRMKNETGLQETLLQKTQGKEEIILTDKQKKIHENYFKSKHYLIGSNILSTCLFTWISPVLTYGYRIDLSQKSIPFLLQQHRPEVDMQKLLRKFKDRIQCKKSNTPGVNLTKSIFSAFRRQFTFIFIYAFLAVSLQMYQPILSHDFIAYIGQPEQRTTLKNIIYFLAMFLITIVSTIMQVYLWYCFSFIGYSLSNTLSLIIYNKAMKHPLITQKQFQISEIINFSQVDAARMTYLGYQLISLLYTPFQIIFGLVLLYIYIGISFLVGFGVMIILMLFTMIFTKIAATNNDFLLKAKDARMKVGEEILQIIKFIKINALEKYFFKKINKKRETQLQFIKTINLCYVATIFIYWLCPPTIVSLTFLTFISLGNTITTAQAFFTIIIFSILQYPIRLLPSAISQLLQIWSSVKRVQKFMMAKQFNTSIIQKNQQNNSKYSIQIQNGYFMWGKSKDKDKKQTDKQNSKTLNKPSQKNNQKSVQNSTDSYLNPEIISQNNDDNNNNKQSILTESAITSTIVDQINNKQIKKQQQYIKTLHEININFQSKKITMIIGDIGCGKSSLLYAMLNQMTPQPQKHSKIIINGTIAYSSQKAWIMEGTVKQNILFFEPYNQQKFQNALYYSCLNDDLKLFKNGVDTNIGEKGVTLSGGQKTRVSLARAIYSDRSIYLLDDVLSAVDVHVGKFIMQKTILKYLKGKSVIMPTHVIRYLQRADNIIIMKNGKIIENGSYDSISRNVQFQQIMKVEMKNESEHQVSKKKKQQQSIVNDLKLQKQVISHQQLQISKDDNNDTSFTEKIVNQLILSQDHIKGQISYKVYLEYIQLNGGVLFATIVIFCMSAWTTLSLLSNIQVQKWCQQQDHTDHTYLFLYLIFSISATFFSGTRAYILVTSSIKQGRTIHKKVMKALLYASITRFYNRVPIGRILNRLSKDLREIDQALGYAVGNVLVCFFTTVSSLIMCLYASTPIVVFPIIIIGFLCRWILRYYLKSQRQCVRLQNITNSPIVSGFTSAVNGVATIRSYGLSQQFLQHQIKRVDLNKRMKITKQALSSWFSLRLSFLSFSINMLALAYTIFKSEGSATLAGLLLTYASMLNDYLIGLANAYAALQLKMISIERVSTFSKLQPQPAYTQYCTKWRPKQEGCNLNAIKNGIIQFVQYSTRYQPTSNLVLQNITFKILKGQKVGIVGRTGAGKSTIINSLLRILHADHGKILVDNKDIIQYHLKDLRSCITMIQQQPTLMNGTVRDNLDPTFQYSDIQINNVVKDCNLTSLVQTKGGLNAIINNDNLSVGERQLICICRAFLKKSPIILIDQATANIDVRNDKLIQQLIAIAFKDSTVVTIAHRLSTLKNYDKILVLGEGKVLQWGTTKELLRKQGGIYRKMWQENDLSYLG